MNATAAVDFTFDLIRAFRKHCPWLSEPELHKVVRAIAATFEGCDYHEPRTGQENIDAVQDTGGTLYSTLVSMASLLWNHPDIPWARHTITILVLLAILGLKTAFYEVRSHREAATEKLERDIGDVLEYELEEMRAEQDRFLNIQQPGNDAYDKFYNNCVNRDSKLRHPTELGRAGVLAAVKKEVSKMVADHDKKNAEKQEKLEQVKVDASLLREADEQRKRSILLSEQAGLLAAAANFSEKLAKKEELTSQEAADLAELVEKMEAMGVRLKMAQEPATNS